MYDKRSDSNQHMVSSTRLWTLRSPGGETKNQIDYITDSRMPFSTVKSTLV